jgi:hypothetical protein
MSIFKKEIDLAPERHAGESFATYRERRCHGKSWLKKYLQGTAFWTSCVIWPDVPGGKVGRKIKVQGTFRNAISDGRTKAQKKAARKARTFAHLLSAFERGLSQFRGASNFKAR